MAGADAAGHAQQVGHLVELVGVDVAVAVQVEHAEGDFDVAHRGCRPGNKERRIVPALLSATHRQPIREPIGSSFHSFFFGFGFKSSTGPLPERSVKRKMKSENEMRPELPSFRKIESSSK